MPRFECHHGDNEGVLWLAQRDQRARGVFDEGGEAFAFLQDVFSRLAQAGETSLQAVAARLRADRPGDA